MVKQVLEARYVDLKLLEQLLKRKFGGNYSIEVELLYAPLRASRS